MATKPAKSGFKPWFSRGGGNFNQRAKRKPLYVAPKNNQNGSTGSGSVIAMNCEPNSFIGWKLYFASKEFKTSTDLCRKIRAMEKHFRDFEAWYNIHEIAETCTMTLNVKNTQEDPELEDNWPDFYEDLLAEPKETLACIGLAMHNIIVSNQLAECDAVFQHPKIYVRPIGFTSNIRIEYALKSNGELIRVTGTVVSVGPLNFVCKMVAFMCSQCGNELVIKQDPSSLNYVYPASCSPGCPARGKFIPLLSSPNSIFQSKQTIILRESLCDSEKLFNTLDVELVQQETCSAVVGSIVAVTGIIDDGEKIKKFAKKGEGKIYMPYLKCFSIEQQRKVDLSRCAALTNDDLEFLETLKSEPSPFRLLVQSFCPLIFGRIEVKAGLILALVSGSDLFHRKRSEIHVLLVGSPGTGKSKLLQACSEVSSKGVFVNGPTSTAVGLTASVSKSGAVDAGALVLAHGGACAIDEFDKMASHAHVLLESMEQQMISVTKCGVRTNIPSQVVIIAAANPISSIYDNTKTLRENIKIPDPLLSRFDLVFTMKQQSRKFDREFFAHIDRKKNENQSSGNSSFFSEVSFSISTANRSNLKWLEKLPGENLQLIPQELLQVYISYVRQNVTPELSEEAKQEILKFYLKLKTITTGTILQQSTFRQIEAVSRLTLARARVDRQTVATREHALDVINLVKFTMIDIFGEDADDDETTEEVPRKKPKIQNVSGLSMPKQTKIFTEHIQSEAKLQGRNVFTKVELKAMAAELGLRSFEEIVDKLNFNGYLLKTVNGYKIT